MTTTTDRVVPAWPQTLARFLWNDRWWNLGLLLWGAVLIGSVWCVPGAGLARFANQALIGQGVVMAVVILVGTLCTAWDGQPMPKAGVFAPLRIAVWTSSALPIFSSAFGPIAAWQVVGLWLRAHGLH